MEVGLVLNFQASPELIKSDDLKTYKTQTLSPANYLGHPVQTISSFSLLKRIEPESPIYL
jgi:hypothetical protein